MIAQISNNMAQRQDLLRQANMIERQSRESLPEENDQLDVQQRYQSFLDALNKHISNETNS